MKLTQFIAMMLFTLVAGVFWGTWFSLSRSIRSITPATFLEVGHTMIGNLGGPTAILTPSAAAAAIVLMVLLYRRRSRTSLALTALAFGLFVWALTITLLVNVPIDNQIRDWTTSTLPADWEGIRNRWEFYHGLRTLISICAVGCLFAGTLVSDVRRWSESTAARAA